MLLVTDFSLKCAIPWVPVDTKLSKADTLRLAAVYIEYLGNLLSGDLQAAEQTAKSAMEVSSLGP